MYELIFKTIVIYFIMLFLLRIMGKREMGELSPFDFVVAIMLAELGVISIEDKSIGLIEGIVPIILLVILELLIAYISLKSNRLRGIITGKPEILIEDGQVNYKSLKRTRYNINDLLMHLRYKDVFNIDEVELAILEPSGDLSVVKKGTTDYGFPVIIDGKLLDNEKITGVTTEWVKNKLKEKGVQKNEILLATVDRKKVFKLYYKKFPKR